MRPMCSNDGHYAELKVLIWRFRHIYQYWANGGGVGERDCRGERNGSVGIGTKGWNDSRDQRVTECATVCAWEKDGEKDK